MSVISLPFQPVAIMLEDREFLVLGVLALLVLVMGIWPQPFAEVLHVSVNDLLAHVSYSKLPAQ